MVKEYFGHDYDASNDPQLAALIGEFKAEGYGIFWRIIEMLHKEGGLLPLNIVSYTAISRSIESTPEVVEKLIERGINIYKLFFVRKEKFGSRRVFKNLKKREDIKTVKRKAGIASAEKRKNSTPVEHASTPVEHNSTKEMKGEERKEKKEESTVDDKLFEMFRRCTEKRIPDERIIQEIGKFKNKYPDTPINQSGPLVNGWATRLNEEPSSRKSSQKEMNY